MQRSATRQVSAYAASPLDRSRAVRGGFADRLRTVRSGRPLGYVLFSLSSMSTATKSNKVDQDEHDSDFVQVDRHQLSNFSPAQLHFKSSPPAQDDHSKRVMKITVSASLKCSAAERGGAERRCERGLLFRSSAQRSPNGYELVSHSFCAQACGARTERELTWLKSKPAESRHH